MRPNEFPLERVVESIESFASELASARNRILDLEDKLTTQRQNYAALNRAHEKKCKERDWLQTEWVAQSLAIDDIRAEADELRELAWRWCIEAKLWRDLYTSVEVEVDSLRAPLPPATREELGRIAWEAFETNGVRNYCDAGEAVYRRAVAALTSDVVLQCLATESGNCRADMRQAAECAQRVLLSGLPAEYIDRARDVLGALAKSERAEADPCPVDDATLGEWAKGLESATPQIGLSVKTVAWLVRREKARSG